MRRSLFAFAALPLLASCNVEHQSRADGNEDVSINASAEGNVSFDLPFMKGDLKLPSSMLKHGSVDIDGVGLPEGAKLNGFSVMAGDKGADVNIGFKSPQTPDEVNAYFLKAFKDKGKAAELKDGAVVTTTDEGKPLSITATAADGGSTGMITIKD